MPGASLGLDAETTLEVAERIERGLPYTSVRRFHTATGLPMQDIAKLIQIPPRKK